MEAERQGLAEYPLLVRLAERLDVADCPGPFGGNGRALEPCRGAFPREVVEIAGAVAGAPGDLRYGERRVLDRAEIELQQALQPLRRHLRRHGVMRRPCDGNPRADAAQGPCDA